VAVDVVTAGEEDVVVIVTGEDQTVTRAVNPGVLNTSTTLLLTRNT